MKAVWKGVGKSIILSSLIKKSYKRTSHIKLFTISVSRVKYELFGDGVRFVNSTSFAMQTLYFFLFSVFTYGFLDKKMFNFFNTKYNLNDKVLLKNPKTLKIWNTAALVPFGVALTRFSVYNGKTFTSILWTTEKEGFRFGEFVLTTVIGSKIHKASV